MTLRPILALSIAALAFASLGVGTAAAGPATAQATTVNVTAKDFYFVLSRKTVKAGRVTFVIRNASPAMHDFRIAGHRSKIIGRGQTTRLTVTLKPGRYLYTCTVDSHAELGMKGYLRVQR
jgi:plastocyanin